MGFGFYGFLYWKSWIDLSNILVNKHKHFLKDKKISYHDTRFKKTVDMFSLLKKRHEIEEISNDMKIRLSYNRTFLRLVLVAFPMTAILGIMTIVMTWN